MMKGLCFASFLALGVSAAAVADEEVDETCALQVRQGLEPGEGSVEQPDSCNGTYFLSMMTPGATLKVDTTEANTSSGSLVMAGIAMEKLMIMADRPIRQVMEIKTEDFVNEFNTFFSKKSGGYPNAVLSGQVKGGGMKQVALVLVGASYSAQGPTLTWKWRSDDDIVTEDLDFDFASMFVDSFFHNIIHHFQKIVHNVVHKVVHAFSSLSCVKNHLGAYAENKICNELVKKVVKKGVAKLACSDAALDSLGLCLAIDAEDDEVTAPVCEGLVVGVCAKVASKITEGVVKEISDGKVTINQACSAAGMSNPCP